VDDELFMSGGERFIQIVSKAYEETMIRNHLARFPKMLLTPQSRRLAKASSSAIVTTGPIRDGTIKLCNLRPIRGLWGTNSNTV
jgi:hypothetical protein